jgi:hypothetical protein
LSGIDDFWGEGALRTSCGRALQIFPKTMTDNILVIDGRKLLGAASVRRAIGAVDRLLVKLWRRARHARTPQIRQ